MGWGWQGCAPAWSQTLVLLLQQCVLGPLLSSNSSIASVPLLCTVITGDSHPQHGVFWSLSGQNEGSQLFFLRPRLPFKFETSGLVVLSVALDHFYRSEMILWN